MNGLAICLERSYERPLHISRSCADTSSVAILATHGRSIRSMKLEMLSKRSSTKKRILQQSFFGTIPLPALDKLVVETRTPRVNQPGTPATHTACRYKRVIRRIDQEESLLPSLVNLSIIYANFAIPFYFPALQTLDLIRITLAQPYIHALSVGLPKLTRLVVKGCQWDEDYDVAATGPITFSHLQSIHVSEGSDTEYLLDAI